MQLCQKEEERRSSRTVNVYVLVSYMESAQQDGLAIRADLFRYSVADMEHWLPLTAICHALPYACKASDV